MPVYQVFVNEKATGDFVTASSPQDAYFDISATLPLTYKDTIQIQEVVNDARSDFPADNLTIQASTNSTFEQDLSIEKPENFQ
ncbi:MAG: hypothetical protein H6Q72_4380 [Firmicutes bacterium]|nr:hypothetical protein [Bacillota bacterium]